MKRFLLLLVLTIASARAVSATAIAVATCTLGNGTQEETAPGFASCSLGSPPLGGGPLVFFQTSVNESILSNGLSVNAELGGFVDNNNLGGDSGLSTGSAADSLALITGEPRRAGIIHFSHSGDATSSINGIGLVGDESGSAAFELGVPFEFSFHAQWGCIDHICPASASGVSFTLFETDGVTPAPISVVPEPSNCGLALFALGLCVWFRVREN